MIKTDSINFEQFSYKRPENNTFHTNCTLTRLSEKSRNGSSGNVNQIGPSRSITAIKKKLQLINNFNEPEKDVI